MNPMNHHHESTSTMRRTGLFVRTGGCGSGKTRARGITTAPTWALALASSLWLMACDRQEFPAEIRQAAESPVAALTPGAKVPGFNLTDHRGRSFQLDEPGGRDVVMTFIFSRCAAVDYCPRMNAAFAELRGELDARPEGENVVLLSVTLDPEHDTPEVLARFALHAAGADSGRWLFATPGTQERLEEMKSVFGATSGWSEETGTIEHNLVTVWIDREATLRQTWHGNRWTSRDIIEALEGRR